MVADLFSSAYDWVFDHYTQVVAIPAAMLLGSLLVLGYATVTTGSAVSKGIDFTGGSAIQVQVADNVTVDDMQQVFGGPDTTVRTMSSGGTRWMLIETTKSYDQRNTDQVKQRIATQLNEAGIAHTGEISVQSLGSSVGEAFFREAQIWAGIGLLLMSAVIFIAFRSVVPSFAVIFAALTDILFAMAGMSLLGIDLTLGSLAALLMLLGYSVDTDILLSTRVLKQRDEDLKERIRSSILTGSTMTLAAVAAFTVLFLVSPSPTLDQIAGVIIIGLVADLPVTWLGNTAILKWYVER